MSELAAVAWMLEAVSQSDGDAPIVQTLAVGHETEAECIHAVKSHPKMGTDVVVAPKRRLTLAEIGGLALKQGEVKQATSDDLPL